MELMVVIALMGILSVMIIPEMRGSMQEAALRSASRETVDVLGLARSRSISTLKTHRIRWLPEENRYLLEGEKTDGPSQSEATFEPLPDVLGSQGAIDARVKVHVRTENPNAELRPRLESSTPQAPSSVAFYPDGTADNAEILLEDRDGFQIVLTVIGTTARVKWANKGRP